MQLLAFLFSICNLKSAIAEEAAMSCMTHRILLGLALCLLAANASAADWGYDSPGESWSWSASSDDSTPSGSSYLGVDIADVTAERLSSLKLKEEHGAEVTMVDQDAPAGKAGLHDHDVIVSMNGTPVESAAQLRRMIRETPAGRVITLGISRDGQPQTVKVELADRGKAFAMRNGPGDYKFEMPAIPPIPEIEVPMSIVIAHSSMRSGLLVENITPQLGDFFGVKNGNGVLIRSVEKGSRAEKAGFRAGDVVVKVNGQAVHDTSDFAHGVKSRSGDSVSVVIMRDKKEQSLTLSLPPRKESGDLMQEESFTEPLLDAESMVELSKLDELAQLREQTALYSAENPEAMKEVQKELCKQRKELKTQSHKQKRQIQKDMENLRKQRLEMKAEWI